MREGAKQRLIGATVIVALVVIFVPMLFEDDSVGDLPPIEESAPPAPEVSEDVRSERFLGPEDSGVGGLSTGDMASQPLDLPPAGDLEPADPMDGLNAPAEPPPADPGSLLSTLSEDELAIETAAPDAGAAAGATPEGAATPQGATEAEAAPAASGRPGWVIQVASLGTSESAAELQGRLRKGGFAAFVEKAEVKGKLYYRVRVGPEVSRAGAERTAAQLRERHRLQTLVQPYP